MSEKASRASTSDVEAQEAAAVKEAPVALPGQEAAEPIGTAPAGPPQFPEGSRDGWLTLVGAWAVMFITFGYQNAFGVYETYYLTGPLRGHSPDDIAWIGSLQMFFMFSSSLFSGPLVDKVGPRPIIGPASMLLVLAIMLTSLCKEYYQFILCQGVLGGICSGAVYTPAGAVVGHYFHKKRPLAMGIITSGSATAGILFPVIIDQLLNHTDIGFGWMQRIIGFICLLMAIVASVFIKPRLPPRKGAYFLPGAFKNPAYSLQVAGLGLACWGIFTPFFYLPSFANTHGMSYSLSFYLITFLNAGSIVGRLTAGAFGVFAGQFNVLAVCIAGCMILIFSWLSIDANWSTIVFSVFYGAFSGGAISTMIATLAVCAPNPNQMGTYIGMASGVFGIAALTGTPINGALLRHYGGFTAPLLFSGACCAVGTVLLVGARIAFAGTKKIIA